MNMTAIEIFHPTSPAAWRNWLKKNHRSKQAVWLVFYRKGSSNSSISWAEAVDAALSFGWIDGKKISVGDGVSHQYFCRRKEKSTWSRINKEKIKKLIKAGLMTEAGHQAIAVAKKNGSWTILDAVEKLHIPEDLEAAFILHPGSKDFFTGLSKSVKKMMLQWIVLAVRAETRQKRIDEIARLAGLGQRPKQF